MWENIVVNRGNRTRKGNMGVVRQTGKKAQFLSTLRNRAPPSVHGMLQMALPWAGDRWARRANEIKPFPKLIKALDFVRDV